MNSIKVYLYEPSGCGGIYHYTYSLADGLSKVGLDVTLLTGLDYELKDKKRDFKISDHLGKSRSKHLIVDILCKFRRRNETDETETISVKSSQPSGRGNDNADKMFFVRYCVIWLENILTLMRQGVDIIHIQWLTRPKEDYYFIRLLKMLGLNVIYTAHNILPHDSKSIEDKNIFSKIYDIADGIIVHAQDNKEEMINMFGIHPGKISVIPHGIYDIFFDEGVPGKTLARNILGLPTGGKVILFFGAIRKYKGLETLVDSFIAVRERIKDIVLLIVGKEGGDEAERKYYQEYLKEISDMKDVVCVREYVTFEEVKYYFSASDLVVLPYIKTYQSGVLLLAYAAGKPVVVTETGGLSDAVEAGRSGFVVRPKDPQSMAEAVIEFFHDPDRAMEMGQYAKDLAETRYSWISIGKQTKTLYRRMMVRKDNEKGNVCL